MKIVDLIIDAVKGNTSTDQFLCFLLIIAIIYIWYLHHSKKLLHEKIELFKENSPLLLSRNETSPSPQEIKYTDSELIEILTHLTFSGRAILYLITKLCQTHKGLEFKKLSHLKEEIDIKYMVGLLKAFEACGLVKMIIDKGKKLFVIEINDKLAQIMEKSYNIAIEAAQEKQPEMSKYLMRMKEKIDSLVENL